MYVHVTSLIGKGSFRWRRTLHHRGLQKCCTEQEKWALIEIMSTSNVRTALREAATRSIDSAHFSILRNGEQTPQGSSSPQRRKYVNSSKALEEHVSLSNQVRCTQDLPKNPIRCTPQATPKRQNKLKDTRAKENCPDFKCEQRGKAGTKKRKFFQKPPWLTGGTRAQPAPTATPATA